MSATVTKIDDAPSRRAQRVMACNLTEAPGASSTVEVIASAEIGDYTIVAEYLVVNGTEQWRMRLLGTASVLHFSTLERLRFAFNAMTSSTPATLASYMND